MPHLQHKDPSATAEAAKRSASWAEANELLFQQRIEAEEGMANAEPDSRTYARYERLHEQAVHSLALRNEGLALKAASKAGPDQFDDALQNCRIVLLRKALRWDPTQGANFSTYCDADLNQAVFLARRTATSRLSGKHEAIKGRIGRAVIDLTHELGRAPTDLEVSQREGYEVDDVSYVRADIARGATKSLDAPTGIDGTTSLGETLVDQESVDLGSLITHKALASIVDNPLQFWLLINQKPLQGGKPTHQTVMAAETGMNRGSLHQQLNAAKSHLEEHLRPLFRQLGTSH